MYDKFSVDYDRFVNWSARLDVEIPFIERQLNKVDAHGVLDAACGTGMHAIALARHNYVVCGADLSAGMIDRARANATQMDMVSGTATPNPRFEIAGFGELAHTFGKAEFDAVICLGNSLPHLLTATELSKSLLDFAVSLRSGGLLLIQNRNFDAVLTNRERWMEPQSFREEDKDWLFLRFYDFDQDGLLTFNIITLQREGIKTWQQQLTQTRLRPLRQVDLAQALAEAGFKNLSFYGNMSGESFNPATSGNLIITGISS